MAPTRSCGGCTLCCKVLEVKPLKSPAGQVCHNCKEGAGCVVWKTRPPICRSFFCLWVTNPKFPEALRPDRCGVVFEPGGSKVLLAMVDERKPTAWQKGIADALIRRFVDQGFVVVVQVGQTKHFVTPPGVTPEACWDRVLKGAADRLSPIPQVAEA